jgi:hypothetical protein
MLRANRHFVWSVLLVLALIVNLLNVQVALADDGTPPPPATEEPTQPPVEPPATETSVSEEEAAPAEDQTPVAEEETPVAELMSDIPENIEIVVVDESGALVPLASQNAAEIMVEADPMWCPEGVLPNGPGCTTNLTIPQLLDLMETNPGDQFSMNGVIYFERSGLTTYNTSFVLDDSTNSLGASYNTLRNFNITLQGGWNGGATNTFDASQPSMFDNNLNAVVQVGTSGNPWVGNVSINDFFVQDNTASATPSVAAYTTNGSVTLTDIATDDIDNSTAVQVSVTGTGGVSLTNVAVSDGTDGSGITITTNSGNISFNNVDVSNQEEGNTANLSSQSGNISITNNSDFDGDNSGDVNQGFVAATVSGSITINGSDFTDAAGSGTGTNYNGATLSAPIVSLTNVTSTANDLNGISISNVNQVTLKSVTASKNGTEISGGSGGGTFSNDLGSGVLVNGNAGSFVSILDGNFMQNQRYGIEVFNATIYIGSAIDSCQDTNASGGCMNGTAITDTTGPITTFVSRLPAANGNGWNNSNVTVTWSCVDKESGVVASPITQTVTTEGSNQSVTGTCTNKAGLTSSNTQTGISIDKTAPGISFTGRSPAANGNGWNSTSVTLNWSCTDSLSGIASGTTSQTVTTEGANQTSTGTCTDRAGNISTNTQTGINIDLTAPSASANALPAPNGNGWNNSAVTVSFSGTDSPSGIGSCSADVILSSEGMGQSASGTCTDLAGNISATATVSGINIDLTDPGLSLPGNITVAATSAAGAMVTYTASASDNFDPSPSISCTAPSGTTFPVGTTLVTCTATDDAGNTFSDTFSVQVSGSSTSSQSQGNLVGGNIIAVTGGTEINLGCFTELFAFGVKLTFLNLCGHQTTINGLDANSLPSPLPASYTFVKGLDVRVLKQGKALTELPENTGIQLDFPSPGASQYALLYWDGTEWIEITELVEAGEVNDLLADATGDELFMIDNTENGLSKALTTEPTGTFVLVKK